MNHKMVIRSFIAVLAIPVPLIWQHYTLPKGYEDSNRPYLAPELIIDKIDFTGISYKYSLTNTGELPVKDLMFSQRAENGISGEFEAKERDLAPKGIMEVKNALMSNISSIQLKKNNSFVLITSYESNIGDEIRKWIKFNGNSSLTNNENNN